MGDTGEEGGACYSSLAAQSASLVGSLVVQTVKEKIWPLLHRKEGRKVLASKEGLLVTDKQGVEYRFKRGEGWEAWCYKGRTTIFEVERSSSNPLGVFHARAVFHKPASVLTYHVSKGVKRE